MNFKYKQDFTMTQEGRWMVLGRVPNKISQWLAICNCGTFRVITSSSIVKGQTKGCKACAWKYRSNYTGDSRIPYYEKNKSKFEELMLDWDNSAELEGVVKLPIFKGGLGKEEICGYSLIDEEFYEKCSKVMWITNKAGYVVMNLSRRNMQRLGMEVKHGEVGRRPSVKLHRYIMNVHTISGKEVFVDHINRDTADNRSKNLRVASPAQNSYNSVGCKRGKYKGVYFKKGVKSNKAWRAYIQVSGKLLYLGTYNTPEEAARVYDEAAKKYFGEFAFLNFPDSDIVKSLI